MADKNLDRVYSASGDREMRKIYDEWADSYDDDVEGNNYLTPGRTADMLARFLKDSDAPIMDYGCGTGLSGVALTKVGFTRIDGVDLSEKMLDIARDLGVYRSLDLVEPNSALSPDLGEYAAITAVGVISKGAAPPSMYGDLLKVMKPGAILAFSLNDLSLEDPEYVELVSKSVDAGQVKLLQEEYGPHLTGYEDNNRSQVVAVEKLC